MKESNPYGIEANPKLTSQNPPVVRANLQALPRCITVEKAPIYNLVLEMALNPSSKVRLFPKLVQEYKRERDECTTKYYIDKSHQNLWHVEELIAAFPDARFIAIQREPYAVVASMLRHNSPVDVDQKAQEFPKPDSILEWHHRWKEFPIPNRFLGISEEIAGSYEQFSMAKKCALRWQAHSERLKYLVSKFGDRVHVVNYENLILQRHDRDRAIGKVSRNPRLNH
ncbi:sulfotransferase [Rhizobium sp. 007]|uniref:sulfotransferase family protein n=1 Tax=Rhizobium sp. 007 TaxID=2785056 RepID=UPI001890A46A|nr:sulfotransferase [Rhizobium sp. 007]QPB24341.1 sulfotransferase [Rhizobium sp. 007]